MNQFFISDTHFGHHNIIRYCQRPYLDRDVMDEALVQNWNMRVGPEDVVFHLGDVSFRGNVETKAIIRRLNGRKILVRGNHDKARSRMFDIGFDEVWDFLILSHPKLLLIHDPHAPIAVDWPGTVLHGHLHGSPLLHGQADPNRKGFYFDVGVDATKRYAPVLYEEVIA